MGRAKGPRSGAKEDKEGFLSRQVFAFDDFEGLREINIALNKDGTLRQMRWRGQRKMHGLKQMDGREVEARLDTYDVSTNEGQKKNKLQHDPTTKISDQQDRPNTYLPEKPADQTDHFGQQIHQEEAIFQKDGMVPYDQKIRKMDDFTKSWVKVNDGLRDNMKQDAQELLLKYGKSKLKNKNGEIVQDQTGAAYTQVYHDQPIVLDYSTDLNEHESELRRKRDVIGKHCPKCGKQVCVCGFMKRKYGDMVQPNQEQQKAETNTVDGTNADQNWEMDHLGRYVVKDKFQTFRPNPYKKAKYNRGI